MASTQQQTHRALPETVSSDQRTAVTSGHAAQTELLCRQHVIVPGVLFIGSCHRWVDLSRFLSKHSSGV